MSQAQACWDFLQSELFAEYVSEHEGAYKNGCKMVGLSPDARAQWPIEFQTLGKFCHYFWFSLPDDPSIRHGAFFKLCDFAEQYVFG